MTNHPNRKRADLSMADFSEAREYFFALGFEAGKAGESSNCKYKFGWRLKAWRDGWYAGQNARG